MEDDPFEYETEHTILRTDSDYRTLIKYIVTLENMRVKAVKDIEELYLIQKRASEDPEGFIESLKRQEIQFPSRQIVPDFPEMDTYKLSLLEESMQEKCEQKAEVDSDGKMLVRGRVFTDHKPETFNQLWSCEEQRRLEELLEIFPEEEVELRRYKKIAAALGTRTPKQVNSRVQKYFLKLAKLGLPIPGRAPKRKIIVSRDPNKFLQSLYKKSTFFPELQVPVKMEDVAEPSVKEEPLETGSYAIKLLRQAKEQRLLDQTSPVWQVGVTCVGCRKDRFMGARWTDHAGTDYCTDCVVQLQPHETLTPVREPN